MKTKLEIGGRIRIVRSRLKMNQREFAQQIGVSNSAVSAYETGDAFPSLPALIKIAVLARVTFNWLILGYEMAGSLEEISSQDVEEERKMIDFFRRASDEDRRALTRMAENAAMVSALAQKRDS